MKSLALALVVSSFAAHAQTSGEKVKKEAAEAVDTSKQYLNEKKEEFEARMEARLVALGEKTKALKATTEKQVKSEAKEKLAALEKQQQAAAERLAAVKKAGGSAWKSLRAGVEQAVDDLDKGLTGPTK